MLGYPVDSDGAVSDKTFTGSMKMQLQTEFGDPKETNNVGMGINLPADAAVIPSSVTFDVNDASTFSASSSVTIFDNMGNPKSATIYYIKTQDPSNDDPTFKYDTRMFVDGEEITPELTRATDKKGVAQFIDKFGQRTTDVPDPAFILEGKGSPLYKADDLGAAIDSTPAKLTGFNLQTYLGDGKTVEIVTDPMHFRRTHEFQTLQGNTPTANSPFWGKDFLLVDIDSSGPVSVDIPPGTYNGVQLAAAVENALRDGFGDDKKVQLTDDIDNVITLDLKKNSGDGKSTGLITPIAVDMHTASIVESSVTTIKEGLTLDKFLVHAQMLMTDALNSYSQAALGEGADGTKAAELGVEGRLFKRTVGSAIANNAIPTDYDVITVAHKNDDITPSGGVAGDAVNRFIAYSNVDNVPDVTTYDAMHAAPQAAYSVDGDGRLNITLADGTLPVDPEVFRFQPVNAADVPSAAFISQVGSAEVAVKSATSDGVNTHMY